MSDDKKNQKDTESITERIKDAVIPGYKKAKEVKQKDPKAVQSDRSSETGSDGTNGTDHGPLVKSLWDE